MKQLSPQFEGQVQGAFDALLNEYVMKIARRRFEAYIASNASAIDAEIDAVIAPVMSGKVSAVTVDKVAVVEPAVVEPVVAEPAVVEAEVVVP